MTRVLKFVLGTTAALLFVCAIAAITIPLSFLWATISYSPLVLTPKVYTLTSCRPDWSSQDMDGHEDEAFFVCKEGIAHLEMSK